jgi:hypothetical protein
MCGTSMKNIDAVRTLLDAVADEPLPVGYDDSEKVLRDFAREIREILDAEETTEA